MITQDTDYIVNTIITIIGLPLLVLFYKYLIRKFKYLENKGHNFPAFEIFKMKYLDEVDEEAKTINKMLYWVVFLGFAWGVIMIILVETFIM